MDRKSMQSISIKIIQLQVTRDLFRTLGALNYSLSAGLKCLWDFSKWYYHILLLQFACFKVAWKVKVLIFATKTLHALNQRYEQNLYTNKISFWWLPLFPRPPYLLQCYFPNLQYNATISIGFGKIVSLWWLSWMYLKEILLKIGW